jgi:hypothetical protein
MVDFCSRHFAAGIALQKNVGCWPFAAAASAWLCLRFRGGADSRKLAGRTCLCAHLLVSETLELVGM